MTKPKSIKKKTKWVTCGACDGKGSYETGPDMHRSAGIVPCSCPQSGVHKGMMEVNMEWPHEN